MILYLDKDSGNLIQGPTYKNPIQNISFKRGDTASVNLVLVSGTTALSAINDGKQIVIGFKQVGDYTGSSFVTAASAYTTNGTYYTLNPSFDNATINALLSSNIANITLIGEVQVTEPTERYSSNVISTIVYNDVIRGSEIIP